jgi:hypothetical protein
MVEIRTNFGITIRIDEINKNVEIRNRYANETTIITPKGSRLRI